MTVIKNIPVFGGLGGGTSNAAFILKYLLKKRVNNGIFNKIEKLIGSDLRLFYYKQGFLDNLKTIKVFKKKQKLVFLLSRRDISCSTHEIYSRVQKYSKKKRFFHYKTNSNKNFIDHISSKKNELQSIVEKKYPLIKKLLSDISIENGCYFSRMSGSGSVCFGLFNNEGAAKKALIKLKRRYPKLWFSIAKTV